MFFLSDIGRTKTRLAVSLDGETVGAPLIRPTPADFKQGLDLLKELIDQLTQTVVNEGKIEAKREGLCLGISRKVWPDAPLKPELEETFGGPVYLVNDAALAGLGEAHYGAGRNQPLVAYLTISTGVGGALIANGRIAANALGFEPGQKLIIRHLTIFTKLPLIRPAALGESSGLYGALVYLREQSAINNL